MIMIDSKDTFIPSRVSLLATTIYYDNNGTVALSRNPDQMKKTKHIDIAYHFMRERVELQELDITYISMNEMIADDLTKALSIVKHDKNLVGMGLSAL